MTDSFGKTRVVLAKAGPSGVGQKTLGLPRTRERFRGNDDTGSSITHVAQ
jgi:hypothetical protein